MWSGSPLKFEHSHQHQQHHQQQNHHQQGQDTEFNNFHLPPQAMPSTPTHTHHRRGQSLSAIPNLPRTPNHHQLRPPVFLHSPMRANSNGLMGVGDVFAPSNFDDNMGAFPPIGREGHRHAAGV